MEIMSKTILQQIITQCAGTQDIIKKLASCDPCGRKSGLKKVAFLLRLSIYKKIIFTVYPHLFIGDTRQLQSNLIYPNVDYPKQRGYSKTMDSPDFFPYYLLQ